MYLYVSYVRKSIKWNRSKRRGGGKTKKKKKKNKKLDILIPQK